MQKAPVRNSRVALVIELERSLSERPAWWRCTISLPGSPATFNRVWEAPSVRLDDDQLTDMISWVQLTVSQAITTSEGTQTRLDLAP